MEDDDDDILYCHEDPLLVDSTPQLPAVAGGDDDDHTTTSSSSSSRSGQLGLNPQPAPAAEDVVVVDKEEEAVELLAEHLGRQRQGCYAPSRGYLEHLLLPKPPPPPPPLPPPQGSSAPAAIIIPAADDGGGGVAAARSRGVHYITYAFGRLGLGAATVFNAVNYLDRFLSINCHLRWESWMVELVSVACLSIACKLDEVNIPSLHDLQMEEVLSHSFRPATIRDMELTLLKALQWRLACVTPYSFLCLLRLPCLLNITEAAAAAYSSCCTRLLIRALAEPSLLLRFESSLIAASALRCVALAQQQQQQRQQDHLLLQANNVLVSSSDHIISQLLQQDIIKDDGDECLKMMQALYDASYYCLLDHPINSHHHQFYCLYSSHQQQWSPVPVIINPSQAGDDGRTTVNRSAVSRRLFGGSTPHEN